MEDAYEELGFAKLDMTRAQRTGMRETVYGPGKTPEQLDAIITRFRAAGQDILATRCTAEQAAYLRERGHGEDLRYDPVSRLLTLRHEGRTLETLPGRVAVCTGGTADVPVAEEAAQTLEFCGVETVDRHYDVGIAGLHRLLAQLHALREADIVIAVAGMEGALGSVIAGLVQAPVIAVPTSVGYGASFQGVAPLLTMLNSCAEGLSVVNIDNGYGAAVLACRLLRMAARLPHPAPAPRS